MSLLVHLCTIAWRTKVEELLQKIWLAPVLLYHFSIWNSYGFYRDWKLKVETRFTGKE